MNQFDHTYVENENFINEQIIAAVLDVLNSPQHASTVVAHVSAEWERKGYTERGPIDTDSSYRTSTDDMIISLEVRVPYYMHDTKDVKSLVNEVTTELAARRKRAEDVAQAVKSARVAALEAELEKLRNE